MLFDGFLREVTPSFGLQWRPLKRRGIERRIKNRMARIGLSHFEEYLDKIKADAEERNQLLKVLKVTISRFFRDQEVFQAIGSSVIPALLGGKNKKDFKVWSIGCASGEEPYSVSILWKEKFEKIWPQVYLSILATDIDENLLERAKKGRYKKSSLKEISEDLLKSYFKVDDGFYILDQAIRENVTFQGHDIIHEEPFPGMDMVFCRNSAFTYFSKESQMEVLKKITGSLRGKGYLVIGKNESLPLTYPTLFVPFFPSGKVYKKFSQE